MWGDGVITALRENTMGFELAGWSLLGLLVDNVHWWYGL